MNDPLVSIIIPCFNAEPWLGQTLDSALSQTWGRIEIIVIDDGSSDGSLALARSYEVKGVRVFSQRRGCAAAARNRGLLEARGEYIQYLDADDLLHPDKIRLQLERLRADGKPFRLASGEWGRFSQTPSEARFEDAASVYRDMDGVEFLQICYETLSMMQPGGWLASRELLDKAGPWDERLTLNDDGEYFSRVMLRSSGILFCPGARVYYRTANAGSLSKRKDPRALQSLFLSMELTLGELLAADLAPRTVAAVAYAWKWLAFELYPGAPHLANVCLLKCRELGGSSRDVPAGAVYHVLRRLLGWKLAKRLRDWGNARRG